MVQKVETAQLRPTPAFATLTGQLICYSRFRRVHRVAADEGGTIGNSSNRWGIAMFKTLKTVDPKTSSEPLPSADADAREKEKN